MYVESVDVAPMQQRMMDIMERRLVDIVASTDPQKLMEQWLPGGLKGLEQWQGLWAQLAQTALGFPKPPGGKSGKE